MIAHSAFHPHQKKLLTPNKPIPEIIPFSPTSFFSEGGHPPYTDAFNLFDQIIGGDDIMHETAGALG
ncbi:MAG: hypothetical protein K0Q79_3739 [Flavipsychrobacter sp.]|jgi:hypothetical protein|nr:hypothetical protein [Flavipsychrobacter sp.]